MTSGVSFRNASYSGNTNANMSALTGNYSQDISLFSTSQSLDAGDFTNITFLNQNYGSAPFQTFSNDRYFEHILDIKPEENNQNDEIVDDNQNDEDDESDTSKPKDFSNRETWNDVVIYVKNYVVPGVSALNTPFKVIQYLYSKGELTDKEKEYAMQAFYYVGQDEDVRVQLEKYLCLEGKDYDSESFNKIFELLGCDYDKSDLFRNKYEWGKSPEELNTGRDFVSGTIIKGGGGRTAGGGAGRR